MNDAQGGKPSDGKSAGSRLPVVWSPKLDAGEGVAQEFVHSSADPAASSSVDEAIKEATGDTKAGSGATSSPPQPSRFILLAASVAIAAAVGAVVGSVSASGLGYFISGSGTSARDADAKALQTVQAIKAELSQLSTLKANLDSATKSANGQFAKLADRLDRVERAEAEPATKLSHIADAVDRLEKHSAPAAAAPAAAETTGSIASTGEMKVPDRVLQDWVVQDVRGNRALVASRYGGMFAVAAGGVLPGLGRVETIKRQDGHWVVVTGRGVITSDR